MTAQPAYRSLAFLSREMDCMVHLHCHGKLYRTALTWNEDGGELVSQRKIKMLEPKEGQVDDREAKLMPAPNHS